MAVRFENLENRFFLCKGGSRRRRKAMSKYNSSSKSALTRRQFIYYSALAAGATALTGCAAPRRISANEKLNIGVVGTGGKGGSDTECWPGENIVPLCDVD